MQAVDLVRCIRWQLGIRDTHDLHRLAQDDNNVLLGQDMRPVEEEVCRCNVGQRHGLDERIRRDSEAHFDLYLSNCLRMSGSRPRGALQDYCSYMKRACRINPVSMTFAFCRFPVSAGGETRRAYQLLSIALALYFSITIYHFLYDQDGEGTFAW